MCLAQKQPLAARAVRETALEQLTEPGFRNMLLYAMTRSAAAVGDGGSAAQWLAQCDSEPNTIAHFSSFRLAKGAAALANNRADEALEAVGPAPDKVPLVEVFQPLAAFVRVAALELQGSDRADFFWDAYCSKLPAHYIEAILERNSYLEPCRRVRARVEG